MSRHKKRKEVIVKVKINENIYKYIKILEFFDERHR